MKSEFILNHIIGHKIITVRPLLPEEAKSEGWTDTNNAYAIELDNGTVLFGNQQPIIAVANNQSIFI